MGCSPLNISLPVGKHTARKAALGGACFLSQKNRFQRRPEVVAVHTPKEEKYQ